MGKMFFKTKLCCNFRAGVCPYTTNCTFAHGVEELRHPPSNWREIMADDGEEYAIPAFDCLDTRPETQKSYQGRQFCKKFNTEDGCLYGENCVFLHDVQFKIRESVAISLSPNVGGNVVSLKSSNWKTRICNKWETTGNCPFGSRCHFAHGLQELHKYGGGSLEMDARDSSLVASDLKQGRVFSKTTPNTVFASNMDGYNMSVVPSQRPTILTQRPLLKWKGPDKISRIYGDWIDDTE